MARLLIPLILLIGFSGILACAGSPVEPGTGSQTGNMSSQELLAQRASPSMGENRYLWGYWDMYWDPETMTLTPVPRRDSQIHLNVRRFLEDTLCQTCLVIGKNEITPEGYLSVEIDIRHPVDDTVLSGFDVRGIAIFNGSCFFKDFGLLTSNAYISDTEYMLVNADGYTELWSEMQFGNGGPVDRPIFAYQDGTWAYHQQKLNTTLNGFIAHHTNFNRRVFDADSHVLRDYVIAFPADPQAIPLEFGYAVDASWAKPLVDPNPSVPDDFPINANSYEAYQIELQEVEGLLTDTGGSLTFDVQVFDHQDFTGASTISNVQVEAPDLFGDVGTMAFDENLGMVDNHFDYRFTISNLDEAVPGLYPMLVAVTDTETIPIAGGVLGETRAYQVFMVEVHPFLELVDTVIMGNAPIEAEFSTETTSCFFSQFPGDTGRAIEGIDSALELIDTFPDAISTGTIGICSATEEIYLSTDMGMASDVALTVFNINTGAVKHTIDIPSLFGNPGTGPIDPTCHQTAQVMWVSLYFENQVGYFSASQTVPDVGRVDVGSSSGPTTIYIDQQSYTVFTACELTDTVWVINGFSHSVVHTIDLVTPLESHAPPAPAAPGMAYINATDTLYVATLLAGKLDYYTVSDESYVGTIELSTGTHAILGVLYDPESGYLFVTGQTTPPLHGLIWVIDPATDEVIAEIETSVYNPGFPAIDPDNRRLFVPDVMGYVDVFQIN